MDWPWIRGREPSFSKFGTVDEKRLTKRLTVTIHVLMNGEGWLCGVT